MFSKIPKVINKIHYNKNIINPIKTIKNNFSTEIHNIPLNFYRDFFKPVVFTGFVCVSSFTIAMIYQEEKYRYIKNWFKKNYPLYFIFKY